MPDFHFVVDPIWDETTTRKTFWVNIPTAFFDLTYSGVWFNAHSGAVQLDEPVDFEPEGHC